jgi:ubiquinone/menaquinone biosynthesis C-methylase UbiE
VVADARFIPFADDSIDTVFSYSVLQHFSRTDALAALTEFHRVLAPGGGLLVQMANAAGARSGF